MPLDGMAMAVRAYRTPSMYHKLSSPVVFRKMLTVIKVAAGDEKTLAEQAEFYRMNETDLQEAAKHLLLHQLLKSNAYGNRLLGLPEGATTAEIKDHKRWLLKWLHPDRNPSAWEQKLFHRVNDCKPEDPAPLQATKGPQNRQRSTEKLRKGWSVARNRQKDASPRRLIFKTFLPLLVGALCAAIIVIAISSVNWEFAKQMTVAAGWFK